MNASESLPHAGQVCGTCLFWRPEKRGQQTLGWGQCRRMPPTMPPIQDDKLVHVGMWPHTRDGDWCGEWQAIAEADGS
jgi:hypothetical protein